MKTHHALKLLLLVAIVSITTPSFSNSVTPIEGKLAENIENPEAQRLINRLEEIKAMDRDKLSKSERKALKREVRDIEKRLATVSGGVYLSIGAIILIILLLILLL